MSDLKVYSLLEKRRDGIVQDIICRVMELEYKVQVRGKTMADTKFVKVGNDLFI